MAITAKGLKQLGFTSEIDFILQDNSDGAGVFIAEWLSASPQPTVSAIEAAEVEYQTAYDAQAYARSRDTQYPSLKEFAEAYTEKEILADTAKWDEYVVKYNKVRSDNPKS